MINPVDSKMMRGKLYYLFVFFNYLFIGEDTLPIVDGMGDESDMF